MLTMTVAICTYERRRLLETCLEHWTRSTRLPDQVIVVDASDDAETNRRELTAKFASFFGAGDSRYITTDVPGLTRQRNLALPHVASDIVCLIDDDTFVRPD